MADQDKVIKVSRKDLEDVFKNPRLVRAMENLINNVQYAFPDDITFLTAAIQEAAVDAGNAQASASAAEALAIRLESALQTLESAPMRLPHVMHAEDEAGAHAIRADLDKLARRVEALEQGNAP